MAKVLIRNEMSMITECLKTFTTNHNVHSDWGSLLGQKDVVIESW